jgi:glucosylceramidase
MTVQNEPMTGWDPWFPWNTCGFNAEMERDFAKMDLGPIMAEGGFPPESFNIMVLDHNRPLAEDWANVVFSDPEASRYVAGLAVHWYFYGTAGPYDVYDRIHDKFPDKFIYATEACNRNEEDENDRIGLGKWALAEDYAHDILLDLLHWVGGWTDWNLVLDTHGGPNWVGNNHSAPIIVNPEAGEFYKNVQYYAMAHFSKFLPPGSRRIGASPGVEVQGELELGAFLRPDGGIVVIVINTQDREHLFALRDPELDQEVKVTVGPHSFNSWIYYN